MSWFLCSHVSLAGLFGACVFLASVAWASPAVTAKLDSSSSSKGYKMEKRIFSKENIPANVPAGISKIRSNNDAEVYSSGKRYFPVMLLSTPDYKSLDSAFIERLFNESGFKENGNYGSMRDYFISSSGGKFKPTFDIYPVALSNSFESYKNEGSLITSSIDVLVERDDFKARADKYEKEIPFIFLHPLSRDKASSYNSSYFNHQYMLQYSAGKVYSKNGYKFNNYAFVSQKAEGKHNSTSSKDVNMLGTFVHEFSHVIGLFDLYSTDANGYATIGPLPYDVMALGLRNGNGGYPSTFSAYEREAVGWLTPTELSNKEDVYVLNDISKMQAYAVSNPNHPDEFFIIEYRPAVGFDSKIGSSSYSGKQGKNGVLIWYVDYDARIFASNDPNGDVSHQRVEVKAVLSKNQESFTDFTFVNKSGKAAIDGIFSVIFDGDDRVCFSVNRSKKLDKCPKNPSTSSSEASLVEGSSSSTKRSSASARSSSATQSLAQRQAAGVQMRISRGTMDVRVPIAGKKTLRFYDILGNLVDSYVFDDSFALINVFGWNRSVYVQLDVDGRMLFSKRVLLR